MFFIRPSTQDTVPYIVAIRSSLVRNMGRNDARIACVRSLRTLALRCGVDRVRDCVGKEAVEAMMANIRASDGDGLVEAKAEAEDALEPRF